MRPLQDCRLYGILDTGYCEPEGMPEMLRRMIAGGIHMVQLRAKGFPPDRVAELGRLLLPRTRAAGVPLLINDHPAVAGEIGAEGAHVGQDDLSVAEARRLAGSGSRCFIGKSTHSLAQAEAATAEGADCIGFGPLFATPTKPDYIPIGVDDIREVHQRVTIPVFCIGGIKRENLPGLAAAGMRRAVIVSGILQAPDPESYVRDCLTLLGQ